MRVVGGAPHAQCGYCGKWVKLSGFFGGLHLCVGEEERAQLDAMAAQMAQQQAVPLQERVEAARWAVVKAQGRRQ